MNLLIIYPENAEKPSPTATPICSMFPVTRIWSPGNSSTTALHVPTKVSASTTNKVLIFSFIFGHSRNMLTLQDTPNEGDTSALSCVKAHFVEFHDAITVTSVDSLNAA